MTGNNHFSTQVNRLNSVLNEIRLARRIPWFQILSILLSGIISFSVIEINIFSINIPNEWKVPIILGIIMIGLIIALFYSVRKIVKLESRVFFFIEDVPIHGLLAHVTNRTGKSKNQVHLTSLELIVEVIGNGIKRDALFCWRFLGTNTTASTLTNLQFSISGDTLIPLDDLNCAIYDLENDPNRKDKISPILQSNDSTIKNVLLPFRPPGIKPYNQFSIELNYSWPLIVNIKKDYFFIDPIKIADSVEKIKFELKSENKFLKTAYIYQLNAKTRFIELGGSLPIIEHENVQHITFTEDYKDPESIYIILFEGNTSELLDK